MKTSVIIYFDEEKTSMQVVRPRDTKNLDWRKLVEGVTLSNHDIGLKNYHSYEIF